METWRLATSAESRRHRDSGTGIAAVTEGSPPFGPTKIDIAWSCRDYSHGHEDVGTHMAIF